MNNTIDWEDLVRRLFDGGGRKTLHLNELVEAALTLGLVPLGEDADSLSTKLSGFLLRNAKSKTPIVSRVKNKKGGYKRGVYRLRPQKTLDLTPIHVPKVSTGFTGAAGEYAVLSELLFRGFNASKMTVDDGIDIVASKDHKYFHIQVKTANYAEGKPYQATIREKAFRHSSDVFYILVMREPSTVGFVNRYAIFHSGDIRRMIAQKVLADGATINLRISLEGQRYTLPGGVDVTHHINDFESIC